ncbi:uncharacterized protein LOC118204353 [Stegodyphus dumicola]|uniref:uncharacterized protein LOC118204353 n=1 Tax=Stegodyphus dumicola TaxID=202533 RepID=UPI0015A9CABE|nr:uncharacterized protein LOC118204353 [Stegodyphus dumicola]
MIHRDAQLEDRIYKITLLLPYATTELTPQCTPHHPLSPENLTLSPFSPAEIARKLYSAENSAPGHDRLSYNHWKAVDPDCTVLAAIFNICLKARKVPAAWKDSLLRLPSCSVVAWHDGSLLGSSTTASSSPSQKGFLPFDGVFENNFVVQQRIQLARTSQSDTCLASLDLSNAFGSVPHDAIFAALRASGVGNHFTELIQELYTDASTRVFTEEGPTDPIPIDIGVRQGCPLSGLLFNLTINPILVAVQGQSPLHRILAYADDLLLLAPSPAELQTQLNLTHNLVGKLGLYINPRKCFSLHISGARPTGVRHSQFSIDGTAIRCLREGEGEEFLGKPIGFNQPPDIEALNTYLQKCEMILNSPLAPWQRIDALKSFVFPSMDFDMRTARLKKTDWAKIDSHVRPLLKRTLNLPPEAANEYLYGAKESACFGIPLAAESSDIARIDSAFKLLTSLDPGIQQLAWEDLTRLVSGRLKRVPSFSEIAAFLSGCDEDFPRSTSNPISSVWSAARSAARRLKVTWTISDDHTVEISHDGTTITAGKRRLVFRTLRNAIKKSRAEKLITYPNQGKAMECAAAAKASSHFFRNGAFTRFADWRFIHRARLNLVPLNGVRRNVNGSRGCRRCNFELETLPHVLCHCMRYSRLYQARHNAVVERIKKAASGRWQLLSENRPVRGLPLRPDIILTRDNACLILDITVAFDNRRSSFDAARREKMNKYRPLIEALKSTYNDVRVEAIVIGALGSWDPNNDKVLSRICSRKYASLMRKLIVSETISKSRDIYVEHLTDVRQENWFTGGYADRVVASSGGRSQGGSLVSFDLTGWFLCLLGLVSRSSREPLACVLPQVRDRVSFRLPIHVKRTPGWVRPLVGRNLPSPGHRLCFPVNGFSFRFI